MMFVTGPLFAGKRDYVCRTMGWTQEQLAARAVWDVQDLAADAPDAGALAELADRLARYEVVIATEVGGGVVPVDAHERAAREAAGRLACLLAQRAETVVRVVCGLPQTLKGDISC